VPKTGSYFAVPLSEQRKGKNVLKNYEKAKIRSYGRKIAD
jgi:hypothetical protein